MPGVDFAQAIRLFDSGAVRRKPCCGAPPQIVYCSVMERPGGARIMVIEDDPDLMRLIAHTLKRAGFTVVQAYGGEDALRKMKAQPPDLILTDLAMPKMSGVEVIAHVRRDEATRHIPIVAVTAYMWDTIASSAGSVGADAFIAKPFNSVRLLQTVTKYLAGRGTSPSRRASRPD